MRVRLLLCLLLLAPLAAAPASAASAAAAGAPSARARAHPYTWRTLAPAAARRAVTPDFPQATLELSATLPPGDRPYRAAAIVVDTDDSRRYAGIVALGRDTRLSVPVGHYAVMAVATYLTFAGPGRNAPVTSVTDRIAFALDRPVTAAGGTADVDLAAATATGIAPRYRLPEPARRDIQATYLYLGDQHHQNAGLSYEIDDFPGPQEVPYQALVQPVPGTAPGLTTADHTIETVGASARRPSRVYQLATYHPDALVLGEHVDVTPRTVATVDSTVYGDPAETSATLDWAPSYPAFDPGEGFDFRLPDGDTRVDLLGAVPTVQWEPHVEVDTDTGGIAQFDFPRAFEPGTTTPVDFLRGPLAPGIADGTTVTPIAPASRTATQLAVGLAPVTDTERTHLGYLFPSGGPDRAPAATRTRIYLDGAQVFAGANYTQPVPILIAGGTPAVVRVPAGAHRVRIVGTSDLGGAGFTRSTRAVSDYRFVSSATSGAPAPKATCAAPGPGGCTVLPLLALSVPLPTTRTGTLAPGTATFVVTAGHIAGARPDPVTDLTFATSTDGTHVTPARVDALGGGRFRVTLHTPAQAAGQAVTTRIVAVDSAGSALTQTVTAAYRVG